MLTDDFTAVTVSAEHLEANKQYSFKITAANLKGESEFSGIRYQYASAVPTGLIQS